MNEIASLLIVDDNPGDVELCNIIFTATGQYPCIYSVGNGEEALKLFLEYEEARASKPGPFPPVMVLLDINMPRMDGFTFLEAFDPVYERIAAQGRPPSVVVMVTSSSNPRDRARALQHKCVVDFVSKPPTKEDAERLVRAYGSPVV